MQRSARQRLAELAEPAVEALATALTSGDLNAVIKTAIAVLDRCGYHPSQKVEVEPVSPADSYPILEWMPTERLETMRAWMTEAEEAMRRGDPEGHRLPGLTRQ